jgi:glycerophosphoryl diester phosphodiesterase
MLNLNTPLIIAHRGESYDAPENTLTAINLAWQRGADGIEIDVHLTMDKQIIVVHSRKIKNNFGKIVPIKLITLDALKNIRVNDKSIPILEEVLMTLPDEKFIFIEIKCGVEIIPYLKIVLQKINPERKHIKIIGFGLSKMRLIKQSFPDFEVILNKKIIIQKIIYRNTYWNNLIEKIKSSHLDGINLSYSRSINYKLIEMFRDNKLKIFVWTINNPKKAFQLINSGVNGIMTDRSGWIREKLNEL